MRLVDDAGRAWRWFSMQSMAAASALQITWLNLPPDLKAEMPPSLVPWLTVAILIAGGLGRMVKQGGTDA
ncbi:hypothetical protein OEW28_18565 [Defluviimonas sp. WL0002]|uniref:Holin n=1 Tax=Albidovulum marisflavi TaxID=2984159 RepID=A0ABT2ZHK7_9RHOB|nr:hypothetical protein [Defluviimonas sp. WL0002]MCV2870620.1 hypothetical protein [Defluviimonas sp. WL0002]